MAQTDDARLAVLLEARLKDFERSLDRAQKTFTNKTAAMQKTADNTRKKLESTFSGLGRSLMSSVSGIVLPVVGVGSVAGLTKYADEWTRLQNLLKSAGAATGTQTRSLEQLREGADNSRSSLESYVDLYANMVRSASGVAKSEQELADATNIVSKAFAAGGASAQAQAAGILQLGQAMGSGVLQGDELRSIRENAPLLAKAIADYFGVTVSELKDLGAEGKLTSDKLLQALLAARGSIEQQFGATTGTIGDAFTKLGNNLTQFIGQLDQATGASGAIANGIGFIGENIDAVASGAAAAAAVILAANGSYIAGLAKTVAAQAAVIATNPFLLTATAIAGSVAALVAFSDEIKPIQGEMATLADYSAVAWDGIKEGAGIAWQYIKDGFTQLVDLMSNSLNGVGLSWEDVWNVIKGVYNKMIGAHQLISKAVFATFTKLPQAIAEGVIAGLNRMIQLVEDGLNGVIGATNKAITAINNISGVVGVEVETIANINLSKLENQYAGAGEAAAAAYQDAFSQLNRDFVGEALGGIEKITAGWRTAANERAKLRENTPETTGSLAGGNRTTSAGGKGGKKKQGDLAKEIDQIKERTKALQDQAAIQAQIDPLAEDYGYTLTKLTTIQQLFNAAQKEGKEVTPEMAASFEILAEKAAQADVEVNKIKASNDELKQKIAEIKDISRDMTRTFIDGMIDGKSATEALGDSLMRLGQRLLDLGLDSIFDTIFKGGGNVFGGAFTMDLEG